MKTSARCVVVATAICSWIAISNHCAFAAVATKSELSQNACPFHSKPAKPQQPAPGIQCCKILRAVFFATAKSWTRDYAKFSDVNVRVEQLIFVAESHNSPLLLLETGPPGKTSFAELILQRSLLAPAPPSPI